MYVPEIMRIISISYLQKGLFICAMLRQYITKTVSHLYSFLFEIFPDFFAILYFKVKRQEKIHHLCSKLTVIISENINRIVLDLSGKKLFI